MEKTFGFLENRFKSISGTIFVVTLFLGLACEHPNAFQVLLQNSEFKLLNASGSTSNRFAVGEPFQLFYSLTNGTGSPISYFVPDSGPIVTFEIVHGDSVIGTSDDEMAYAGVIVNGGLNVDETISWQYSWYSVELHKPLPPGDYVARAQPRLVFRDAPLPAPVAIAFTVTPANEVIITDQPPGALQLDPFQLNAVQVTGAIHLLST